MTHRKIIFYWLLLFIPTLVVGGLSLRLLRHEGERLRSISERAAMDKARLLAESMELAVLDLEQGLMQAMEEVPEDGLVRTLRQWQESNPLIRNVFVWSRSGGLRLPDPESPPTGEERDFINRYQSFFSGRQDWRAAPAPEQAASATPATSLRKEFRKLSEVSYGSVAQSAPVSADLPAGPPDRMQGWQPWFWEDQMHLLGWVSLRGGDLVYGVELEMMALLSRLLTALPAGEPDERLILRDGQGRVVYQSGPADQGESPAPAARLPVGSILPHWEVESYADAVGPTGAAFVLLSSLLVGIFMAALLAGGTLLLWQAHRNLIEARQKTNFVSNVSHELKTPLTTIRMYAELMGEGRVADPEKKRSYLEVIISESQRLTRLVNNVLDFSRLEQGRKKYQPQDLDLTGVVRDVAESQRVRLAQAGLKLDMALAQDHAPARLDRDALEQIVLNLMDNAIKYAAAGGELRLELRRDGAGWLLQILDRGPGIPPDHRERVFDKFHRVDESLTAAQGGSGLGLSIARRLMRDQGGDILYSDRAGGGSCFAVIIPSDNLLQKEPKEAKRT